MAVLSEKLKDNSHWGFFGGAFDPPHTGHLALAKSLCDSEGLTGIILAPTFHPPHRSTPLASFADRMAMCKLASSAEPDFLVTDIESDLPTPGYTVDVITVLQNRFPQVRFSILIGADNLEILASWNRIESLLEISPLIVGSRPQYQQKLHNDIEKLLPPNLRERIHIVQSPLIDISSSALRRALRDGQHTANLINRDVAQYIQSHGLYNNG